MPFLYLKNFRRMIKSDKGSILVFSVFALLTMFGMAGLATELAFAYMARTQVQNASDLAALAGAKYIVTSESPTAADVTNIAHMTARQNSVIGEPANLEVNITNVSIGNYDPDKAAKSRYIMTMNVDTANAVQVTMDWVPNIGANLFFQNPFTRVLGWITPNIQIHRISTAAFGTDTIVGIFDLSASMAKMSYKSLDECPDPAFPTNESRRFLKAARHDATTCFTPYQGYYLSVMPEPATTMSKDFQDYVYSVDLKRKSLGFIAFDSTVSHIIPPEMGNLALMRSQLLEWTNIWRSYASNDRTAPTEAEVTVGHTPWPGGYNFPASGYSNIGAAIQAATASMPNAGKNLPGIYSIVLFSDGKPNCDDHLCATTNEGPAKFWTTGIAMQAAAKQIRIHTVYYQSAPGEPCGSAPGYVYLRDSISMATGGQAFCPNQLPALQDHLVNEDGTGVMLVPE